MNKKVIIDTCVNEFSTDEIFKYLIYLFPEIKFKRQNTMTINSIDIEIEKEKVDITINEKTNPIIIEDIDFYYYRRGSSNISNKFINKSKYTDKAQNFFDNEVKTLREYLYSEFELKKSYGSFRDDQKSNKLTQLQAAMQTGIKVPATLITTQKKSLLNFSKKYDQLIIKPIGDHISIPIEKGYLSPRGTQVLAEKDILQFDNEFAPTLVQQCLEKKFELRCYYYNKSIHSMAIFSQSKESSKVDFRNIADDEINRNVPYQLENVMEQRIHSLMEQLNLDTGSLDFIISTSGEFYFLEVNTTGQFGWVSGHCNYYLEKQIAKHIVWK